MIGHINNVAAGWWWWMFPMLWQTALLAGFVWGLDLLMRRRGWPQVRYALWLLVFARLLVPPTFALPTSLTARLLALRWAAPAAVQPRPIPRPAVPDLELPEGLPDRRPASANFPAEPDLSPAPAAPAAATAVPPVPLTSKAWAMLAATAVSLFFLAWLLMRVLRLRRLARRAAENGPVPAPIVEALAQYAAELRLRRLPRLAMTDGVPSAAVCGVFRPILFLPMAYRDLPREQLGHVLLHELAHLKRRDLLVNAAQSVLHILYWFNPVLWLAGRRLRNLREICCDATVANVLRERTGEYSRTLVDVAGRASREKFGPALGLVGLFESPSRLRQRIEHLARPAWKHRRLRWIVAAVSAAVVVSCVAPMGTINPMPVKTRYPYCAHFVADSQDGFELYIKDKLVGKLPFYISAEDLAQRIHAGFGIEIQPKTDEFFVSRGRDWHNDETFENGPHWLGVDGHPEARFRLLRNGVEVPVVIESILIHGGAGFKQGFSEYRFIIRPMSSARLDAMKPTTATEKTASATDKLIQSIHEDLLAQRKSFPWLSGYSPQALLKSPEGKALSIFYGGPPGAWEANEAVQQPDQLNIGFLPIDYDFSRVMGGARSNLFNDMPESRFPDLKLLLYGHLVCRSPENEKLRETILKIVSKRCKEMHKALSETPESGKAGSEAANGIEVGDLPAPIKESRPMATYEDMLKLLPDADRFRMPTAEEIKRLGPLWPSVPPEENAAYYFARIAALLNLWTGPDMDAVPAGSAFNLAYGDGKDHSYAGDAAAFSRWVEKNRPALELVKSAAEARVVQLPYYIERESGLPSLS